MAGGLSASATAAKQVAGLSPLDGEGQVFRYRLDLEMVSFRRLQEAVP